MSTSARRRLMRDFKVCALEMLIFELFISFLFFDLVKMVLCFRWASPVC